MFKTNKELLRKAEQYLYLKPLSAATALYTIAGSCAAAIKCWHAAMHRHRITGGSEFAFTTALCRQFGILDRRAKDRGLRFLEKCGIIQVQRQNGKNPLVRLNTQLGTRERRVTLRHNQVLSIGGELKNLVRFNESDDYTARAVGNVVLRELRAADKSGASLDCDLVDYGTGWIVEEVRPTSGTWTSAEVHEGGLKFQKM